MRDIENYSIELHKKNLPSLYPYIKYNKKCRNDYFNVINKF